MATIGEGQSTHRPPLFSGNNYGYWKARMKIFIQSVDYEIWRVIVNGYMPPIKIDNGSTVPKEEHEFNDIDVRNLQVNARAMNLLYCALEPTEFNRISTCDTAKEIWDKLEVTHEGTNQVKESKISILVHTYELFKMNPDESISEMFTRFTNIINSLKSLGKIYTNVELVRKILRSLPKTWEAKVTAIIEAKDLNKLSLDELLGSLLTHELTMKEREEETGKKKSMALKSSLKKCDDDTGSEEDTDEELAMLTRKFKRFIKRKGENRRRGRKDMPRGESSKKEEGQVMCYECKKPGHYRNECPLLKKVTRKPWKKALITTWSDCDSGSSDSESEKEVANLCLMATQDEEEVCDSPSYDELQDAFSELHEDMKILANKNITLKRRIVSYEKEIESLKHELRVENEKQTSHKCSNENDLKEIENLKTKIIDIESILDENKNLKLKIEDLNQIIYKFTLGKENFEKMLKTQRIGLRKIGLGYKSTKNNKYYKNYFVRASSSYNSHVTCFHCNINGHYQSSCPMKNKMIAGMKKIWVPKGTVVQHTMSTNLVGPKVIWVPKS